MFGNGGTPLRDGQLRHIAPTRLALMGLPKPAEMTGGSLLRRKPVAAQ